MYTHNLQTGVVVRDADNLQVAPYDYPANENEKAYQDWLEAGNGPTPFVAQAIDVPQLVADVGSAVQTVLDAKAQAMGYESILSAVTYAGSLVPKFATEGNSLKAWRDSCWAYCYDLLAQAQAGTVAVPTIDEVVSGLPQLVV